jgi:hypothetical protein
VDLERLLAQFGFARIAKGRPPKRISGAHAKALLSYKLRDQPLAGMLHVITRTIPDSIEIPYPAEDPNNRLLAPAAIDQVLDHGQSSAQFVAVKAMKSMLDLDLQLRFRSLQHLAQHIQVLTGHVESDSGCLHTSTFPSTAYPQYRSIESGIQASPSGWDTEPEHSSAGNGASRSRLFASDKTVGVARRCRFSQQKIWHAEPCRNPSVK